jgi:NADPH:quinone reductase-like Zn-dependent oxidoreductase
LEIVDMKAVRVHRFGGPEVMLYEDIARPIPASDEVLVRIEAAGVGPWDAWIRSGRSALPQPLPLTLGSDLAGVVEDVGNSVTEFRSGHIVYGVTNSQFTGAYAQYAVAKASMLAEKPSTLNFIEAASLPVISMTAWQMLFDYATIQPRQRVLILGAAGSVGSIAVQLARQHDAYTIAGISSDDAERMMRLGADQVVDTRHSQLTDLPPVDAVIDAAGGDRQRQAMTRLKRGGYIISSVSAPDPQLLKQQDARGSFFLVKTTTRGLRQIANLIDRGVLSTRVGSVLPLEQAQIAHQMLDGIKPYARGKIVLTVTRNNP